MRALCAENIAAKKHELAQIYAKFSAVAPLAKIELLRGKLDAARKELELLSIDSVLERGFAMAVGENGEIIKSAKAAPKDAAFALKFYDGQIGVIQTCKAPKP